MRKAAIWAILFLAIILVSIGIAGIAMHKPRPMSGVLFCQPGSAKCAAGLQRSELLSDLEIPGKNFRTPDWVPAFGTKPVKTPIK